MRPSAQRLIPPAEARESAGYSLHLAAKTLRVSPAYLRRIERGGSWSFGLAERAARLYGCRIEVFLSKRGDERTR